MTADLPIGTRVQYNGPRQGNNTAGDGKIIGTPLGKIVGYSATTESGGPAPDCDYIIQFDDGMVEIRPQSTVQESYSEDPEPRERPRSSRRGSGSGKSGFTLLMMGLIFVVMVLPKWCGKH